MKQVLQNLKTGQTEVVDVPAPHERLGELLIASACSLVSVGTERMLVEFGKANLVEKARQQPDKIKMVLNKIGTDGLIPTLEAVQSKLDQPIALGYCNVGRVVSARCTGFEPGQRVVSNGHHAEFVRAPKNLCAAIPDNVDDESATFTVLTAIALQGVRLLAPTLGETVVVTGLGLIGLLAVQILKANGCRVLGIDLDDGRCALAREFGAETVDLGKGEDPIAVSQMISRGRGVDAVLITASTKSNEPIHQAATMCRKRGRIVLVGVVGMQLSRADFYEKELSFQVSCSYGPGRYDPEFEEKGNDYPLGYVRWTEQRNFEAVLDLLADGALDIKPLITHRFSVDQAPKAYDLLTSNATSLGIVLHYPQETRGDQIRTVTLAGNQKSPAPIETAQRRSKQCVVGFLGAGNYAGRVLMPAFQASGAALDCVVSGGGISATHYGRKYKFRKASTETETVVADMAINTIVVATRHNAHARQVLAAMGAGKNVFCEKPLCLTIEELNEIQGMAVDHADQILMVGFNRRFAPHTTRIKDLLDSVHEPKSLVMTVNAGAIPPDHWTQDTDVGGGRIVGEACHFIDLLRYLVGYPIRCWHAVSLGGFGNVGATDDKSTIVLQFEDGSLGTIHYLANGHKAFPKERLEVFCGGRILQLDNFRKLKGWGWLGFSGMTRLRQDKGQQACVGAFVDAVKARQESPIPLDQIIEVSRVSIEVAESLRA